MPISGGKYVAPSWVNDTSPYINASELNAISTTLACVPLENGGTGATGIVTHTINNANFQGSLYEWGKLRLLQGYTTSITEITLSGMYTSVHYPRINIYLTAPCSTSTAVAADIVDVAKVVIKTNGDVYIKVMGSTARVVRFSAFYFTN